ncbi:hypothetical protein yc1106_09267 [Curvularia clavata]|uniref:Uncharacterized protein n=1 Tax=Curvularia clavata TaxID=95742 RepID=A0A9Q8ZL19_CURCL|nr:hypothetical protein yc1106_09267 [Curvularia clavata]
MQFRHILPALFVTSGLAAKFERFKDATCQNYAGKYSLVTEKQLEDLVVQGYPTARVEQNLSLNFPDCPSNKDDTFRFVYVPQWSDEGSKYPKGNGGGVAVVYYDDTDTYLACIYLASVQPNGYAGFCK